MNQLTDQLVRIINEANYLVALTGAGISTESGVPDYRGPEGVWTRRDRGLKPLPSTPIDKVQPNKGHNALVKLLEIGKLKFLISQNVDNLHLKSGIPYDHLVELHGNHNLLKCLSCDRRYTLGELHWDKKVLGPGYRKSQPHKQQPNCPECGGRIISSIINFGDPMPEKELQIALYHAKKADVFLILGSSLVVHPAASLPMECYAKGGKILIINKGETPLDDIATLKIDDSVGEILEKTVNKLVDHSEINFLGS